MEEITGTDQKLLSQKPGRISGIFIAFSESIQNFSQFEMKR